MNDRELYFYLTAWNNKKRQRLIDNEKYGLFTLEGKEYTRQSRVRLLKRNKNNKGDK